MSIKREDVDRETVDFSDLASGKRLPPVHPGEILRDEYLVPLGLSVYRLARELKIPRPRLNDIVLGPVLSPSIPRSVSGATIGYHPGCDQSSNRNVWMSRSASCALRSNGKITPRTGVQAPSPAAQNRL